MPFVQLLCLLLTAKPDQSTLLILLDLRMADPCLHKLLFEFQPKKINPEGLGQFNVVDTEF